MSTSSKTKGEVMTPDEQMNVELNKAFIVRFPYLFEGLDPDDPSIDCAKALMAEYKKIEDRQSELSASQRFEVTHYMDRVSKHRNKHNDAILK